MSVSVVVKGSVGVTADAPHWDEETESLLYIDSANHTIHRWNSLSKEDETLKLDEPVNFAIPSSDKGYIVGLGGKIAYLDWNTRDVATLFDATQGNDNVCFNEGKCDASGRLWAGTAHSKLPTDGDCDGSLFCMRRSGRTIKKMENLAVGGGVTWSNDNTIMYRSDPHRRKIYAFDFDFVYGETAMATKRTAIDFTNNKTAEEGQPRGLCCDTEGKIWVAFCDAGKVVRYDPITGERLREVTIPAKSVTSCCFGGENMKELFVTTAESGSVFRVTNLGASGEPAPSCLMDGTLSP